MGKDTLKNSGRIFFLLVLLFTCNGLYAVEIETELSPSKIATGESATLQIKITGKSGKVTPVKFPAVNGLQISFSGSSRSFQFINGKTWSGTVLTFSIYGERKGEYKIPPFILEANGEQIASREVSLFVRESSQGVSSVAGPLRGEIGLSADTVFTGEPFIIRYFIDSNGGSVQVEGFSEQPHVKGFVMKALDEKWDEDGKIFAGSFCMVPVEPGVHEIGGGSVDVVVEVSQGFFSMNGRKRILFPRKKIKVIPIPSSGKPENFKGDVGDFKINAEVPAGKFSLYEEIKIPVKVTGRGNLLTLASPVIENEEGIKFVIEEKGQTLSVDDKGLTGEKNFLITLIPQVVNDKGNVNPGRIFIDFFNPYKRIYEKTESQQLSFEIQKEKDSAEKREVKFSSENASGGKLSYLIIAVIVTGLSASVIALVMWERKKFRMIKAELKEESTDDTSDRLADASDEILTNIQTAVKDKNLELFLLNADRGINRINPDKLNEAGLLKYNQFKEKIYYCRYGGGIFDDMEMNELSAWMKKSLK